MTPKLTSVAEGRGGGPTPAPSLRFVIVTLDNHLAGAAERAWDALRGEIPGLHVSVHAAADWGEDAEALERCRADIARGDIILASMLFMEDHVNAVLPALQARRENCAALIGIMSAGEVVKLTRAGQLDMGAPASGLTGFLKRLRGNGKKGGSSGAAPGAKQMAVLRRLPKILRFIPGKAQDLRAYFLTLQYWLSASDENVARLVRFLVGRYGPDSLRALSKDADPHIYPDVGLYHPQLAQPIIEDAQTLPAPSAPVGTVGVLMLRSYILAGDAGHYDGAIAALEAQGLRVIPAFASGLDARPAIEHYFLKDGQPVVDAVISLTGFSLVGGPAYNDAAAAEEMLAQLDVPYIAAHALEFQTLQEWGQSQRGLSPVEATIMVAIPELDGAVSPGVYGGRVESTTEPCGGCARRCTFSGSGQARPMHACPERAERLASRASQLVALRSAPAHERRIGIVLFNFPPNGGAVGTAAHLDVFASLHNTLHALKDAGYQMDIPESPDALRAHVLKGNADRYGSDANVHARISADDHVRREPHLEAIEAQWGPAPGRQNSDGAAIQILGAQFGNVFVGVQPAFGYEGDPMRLLFEGGFAPTHAFSAFYRYLREDFGAHALLHFGTHGALEFMPGKHTGLGGDCWPDRLIGDVPNFYLYAANNPSEGVIAKRRSQATLISYLTPPVAQAGLYKDLEDLKAALVRYRGLAPEERENAGDLVALIHAQADTLDLLEDIDTAPGDSWTAAEIEPHILRLTEAVRELEETLIPHGLHVVGEPVNRADRADLLAVMGEAASGAALPAQTLEDILNRSGEDNSTPSTPAPDDAQAETVALLRAANDHLQTDSETPAIVHALSGGYIRPVSGGDVMRAPDILPTGRNMHGFDPFRVPSAYAMREGARQAELLIARHAADHGQSPETIAFVLWGADNLKSEGTSIAQALALMGARARFDGFGRLAGAELIPLSELGRPRVDVMATLSGIFRDLLPLQTKLLAEAAWLAASAEDEPLEQNIIRRNVLAHQAATGCDFDTAALRVFSNADGAYGANVNQLLESGMWGAEDELADAFEARKSFAYGRSGEPVRQEAVFKAILNTVDAAYQNLDSVELGVTTIDHYFDTLGGVSRAVKRARAASGAGGEAAVYVGDHTRGAGKVRTVSEQVALETRTRMLNPRWYEGMLKHGYEGVRQIEAHVTNTMGWSATTGSVSPWVYEKLTETFVLDASLRERLAALNPRAAAKTANRLLEAHERDYWRPDPDMLAALRDAAADLEDRVEGVAALATV